MGQSAVSMDDYKSMGRQSIVTRPSMWYYVPMVRDYIVATLTMQCYEQ